MKKYEDRYRPQYHFTPPSYWMNDPNGLFFYQGEYHLFYQHNPYANKFGHLSWGHAVSKDLIHWEHLPVAITEEDGIMIFSGCIVIDYNNSSGFGKGKYPPIVAVYAGNRVHDGRQFQCLAYSNDGGIKWTKYKHNPVLDINSNEFRDPKVFFYEPDNKWIMIVATGLANKLMFFSSKNLIEWKHISDFSYPEYKKIKWECPDIFRIRVENDPGNVKWVLFLSKLSDNIAKDTASTYFVGDFNGTEFIIDEEFNQALLSEKEKKLDFGRDFYATGTWLNFIGESDMVIGIAWMNNWKYAECLPTSGWSGSMTLPRLLYLYRKDNMYKIIQKPVKALTDLRRNRYSIKNTNFIELNDFLDTFPFTDIKYEIVIDMPCCAGCDFSLELYNANCVELKIEYTHKRKLFIIDRDNGSNTVPDKQFYNIQEIPYNANGRINLQIFLDSSSVEIFVNGGELVITSLFFTSYEENFIRITGNPYDQMVKLFELGEIESISSAPNTINSMETGIK